MPRIRVVAAFFVAASVLFSAERTIDDFFREFTDEWMRLNTDQAAARRYFTGPEQDATERKISPATREFRMAVEKQYRKGLAELRKFDKSRFTASQRRSAEILEGALQSGLEFIGVEDFSFPLRPSGGAHSGLPSLMAVTHTVNTPRDADNYVARLEHVAPRMDEVVVRAKQLIDKKMTPPQFILRASIAQIEKFVAVPPARNALVQGFDDRMAKVTALPADKREQLRAAAEKITAEQIYPAWRRALALLEKEAVRATNDAGLWRLPGGLDAYETFLKLHTTTNMTADEIHRTGLKLVAEIEQRMDKVVRELGFSEGTFRERLAKARDAAPVYASTEEGRAKYIAEIQRHIVDAEKRAALLFERMPTARVIAQPYPEFMGARAASYRLPARDGSRPGVYQFPIYGLPLTTFGLRTTVYHESIPGHHFQLSLQMEDVNLPRFLRERLFPGSTANAEGWGLYAERVAAESGWYEGDPMGLLGQLDAALFRARRLVVDTGLHAKRWTRQQAVDYLETEAKEFTESEVDRYVSTPGQACAYMIGELKFVELRERAKRETGPAFSLREYHNFVLSLGSVPLGMLDAEVNRWIKSKKS
jgi:uncharacterized protein (DUF885 family)